MEKHAVYAITSDYKGEREYFRVGQCTDWPTAQNRQQRLQWTRLWDQHRAQVILANRRRYFVHAYEVRAVDRHGRGLGSERHHVAIPVPYRANRYLDRL